MKKITLEQIAETVDPVLTETEIESQKWHFIKATWSKPDEEGRKYINGCEISHSGFMTFLRELGFRRWDMQGSFCYVLVKENVVEKVPIHILRQNVCDELDQLPEQIHNGLKKALVIEKMTRSLESLTSDAKLSAWLAFGAHENKGFVEHDAENAYFFYKNGWVSVSKNGISFKGYEELPGLVWKDQILARDYTAVSKKDWDKGQYRQFCQNVSGRGRNGDDKGHDNDRFAAFCTITGYLCHTHFNVNQKAAIFMDARMSDEPDGRSGKSLHAKAIGHMISPVVIPKRNEPNSTIFSIVDGKIYDAKNNRFALDSVVTPDTQLVIFDDIRKDFPLDLLFNGIVDGIMIETKGGRKFRILAKVIITLNYTLSLRGGSAKDRAIEFEWADYYSADYKPISEFGNNFFIGWTDAEWAFFDAFMLGCVLDYFKFGILKAAPINANARKLNDETNPEFVIWLEEKVAHEKEFDKKQLYHELIQWNEGLGKATSKDFSWLKQRTFTSWLKTYCVYRPEIAGYQERRSDSKDLFRFFYNQPISSEFTDDTTNPIFLFPEKSGNAKGIAGWVKKSDNLNLPF